MDVRQGFQVAPGKCFTCNNSDPSLWVIDTGADHPGEVKRFRVYICAPCVLAAAKMLDEHTDSKVVSNDLLSVLDFEVKRAQGYLDRAERAEAKLAGLAEHLAVTP